MEPDSGPTDIKGSTSSMCDKNSYNIKIVLHMNFIVIGAESFPQDQSALSRKRSQRTVFQRSPSKCHPQES